MKLKYFAAAAGVLALAACNSEPTPPKSLRGKAFMADDNGTPIVLRFEADEMRVSGYVVNLYNGEYSVKGKTIKFSPLAVTMMAGPEAAMNAEREYFVFLDTVNEYSLKGSELVLKGAEGREMVFQEFDDVKGDSPVFVGMPDGVRITIR